MTNQTSSFVIDDTQIRLATEAQKEIAKHFSTTGFVPVIHSYTMCEQKAGLASNIAATGSYFCPSMTFSNQRASGNAPVILIHYDLHQDRANRYITISDSLHRKGLLFIDQDKQQIYAAPAKAIAFRDGMALITVPRKLRKRQQVKNIFSKILTRKIVTPHERVSVYVMPESYVAKLYRQPDVI